MTVVSDYTALLQDTSWAGFELSERPMFVTYSFPISSPTSNADADAMGPAASTFTTFGAAAQALARQALKEWADACGLVLLEVEPDQGDITFGLYDFSTSPYPTDGGIGFNPGGNWDFLSYPYFTDHREFTDLGGNIMINTDFVTGSSPDYGLLLHEIGHALGLKHPFELRAAPHDVTLDPLLDNTANTVMSYTGAVPTMLGEFDKQAVAFLYGGRQRPGGGRRLHLECGDIDADAARRQHERDADRRLRDRQHHRPRRRRFDLRPRHERHTERRHRQ